MENPDFSQIDKRQFLTQQQRQEDESEQPVTYNVVYGDTDVENGAPAMSGMGHLGSEFSMSTLRQ